MKKTLHLFLVLLFFMACKSENERRIIGKWQALQLMECDNVIPIQVELVDIEFMSNGKYIFHSTLNVKEAGDYRIHKNFLFTQDRMREKAPEKAVLIKSLEEDTLVLQMSFKGKDQWLTLVKDISEDKAKNKKEVQTHTNATGVPTTVATTTPVTINPLDSIQKKEEAEKKATDKEVQRKKEEAAADKKREAEADRKQEAVKKSSKKEESNLSSAEAYKKREAKRIADERKEKEASEKKAAQFRKEYAIREAERKKREVRKN